ncbi:adenosylcobinamide-GDP ribazoletransferase [Anaerosporobacter sp.]|uniref:adenosylcobinamide-GDP ribazoletransferase n=1 Tax=Anaerosporobacter sp. TaxID=1872529 RepID=UPI00286F3976|nr:adenosylcobinamide-GDP ribazoletransferase [Anaerosporobacter sp.]
MLAACIIAFSMYSKIPMPRVDWNEKNMKYAFCFFPLVGAVLGAIVYGIGTLLLHIHVGSLCFAALMSVIPIFFTGGIHVDGLLDTLDALHSYGDREKKLEILKDPHTGAFAIIGAMCYFILSLGAWSEIPSRGLPVIAVAYVLTRALSGLSVVTFPLAKNTGLAATFSDLSHKSRVKVTMIVYSVICSAVLLWIDCFLGIGIIVCSLLMFGYHYHVSRKQFGGITGDLAGYFLQLNELVTLLWVAIACGIGGIA